MSTTNDFQFFENNQMDHAIQKRIQLIPFQPKHIVLAIVGSRDFHDIEFFKEKMILVKQEIPFTHIVSGGAKGADTFAKQYAQNENIPFQEFLPEYHLYPGSIAPLKRNKQIVNACDVLVAFPTKNAKGTFHSIQLAKRAGKQVFIFQN